MNQEIRNKLRNVVTQCRRLLEDSISQDLEGKYGIFAKKDVVTADPNAKMGHLSEEEQSARRDILDHFGHIKARGFEPKEALDQLVREIAFTHLNRLCAYKMMEAREVYVGSQKFREAVSRGVNSNGVKFYLAGHPDDERLFNTGQQDIAYRHFLDWLGSFLSEEIGVLFNPNDPANRLYPRQKTLDAVLDLLNSGGIKPEETELREQWPKIWSQDETIGWVYQYFTPKELRDKTRADGRQPQNSYELAFLNQFFTPRYVVEFLADNTLGRIWYEMRKANTKLKDQCRYMVRRPTEIFLNKGEELKDAFKGQSNLSREEQVRLPVYIPHRAKKDPRELRILDPACGSGHFLLYCFDLLLTIYEEAYTDPELGPALQKEYPKLEDLQRDVPRLILAFNLYGIDIDLRCSQIAALALWLRCQRAYQEAGLKKDRPTITRSNFVCAEPMPGEPQILKEFVTQLEPKFLGHVVQAVFVKMKLAGEAGLLLKIDTEIVDVVTAAKKQWLRESTQAIDRKGQPLLFTEAELDRIAGKAPQAGLFDLSDITDAQFFEQAETRVIEALRLYAEKAQNSERLQRRLFSDDAVRGFAFVDMCHRRFDVILMNPPFGSCSRDSEAYVSSTYPASRADILAVFVERMLDMCTCDGMVGVISSRTCFFLGALSDFRDEVLGKTGFLSVLADLGEGVLEAMVEVAIYVLHKNPIQAVAIPFIRSLLASDKAVHIDSCVKAVREGSVDSCVFMTPTAAFSVLATKPYCYWVSPDTLRTVSALPRLEGNTGTVRVGLQTSDDFRFLRLIWEVPAAKLSPSPSLPMRLDNDALRQECLNELSSGKRWAFYSKTDEAKPWLSPLTLVVDWENAGQRIKDYARQQGDSPSRSVRSEDRYFESGFSYMLRSVRITPYIVPAGVIPTAGRAQVYPLSSRIGLMGVLSSNVASAVARFRGEQFARPKFQASIIQELPVAKMPVNVQKEIETLIDTYISSLRSLLRGHEPLQEFCVPTEENRFEPPKWNLKSLLGASIELELAEAYGLTSRQYSELERDISDAISIGAGEADSEATDKIEQLPANWRLAEQRLSYCFGVLFGRWDVRFAMDSSLLPKCQGPFDRMPACPPGSLVSSDGLPASSGQIASKEWLVARPNAACLPALPEHVPAVVPDDCYPVKIAWDGILVEDAENPDDIVRRIQMVLELAWKADANDFERRACEAFGVSSLRSYVKKSGKGGFWEDHIRRYSVKRSRKAPIYWLLQSSRKNYGMWFYYHRLDKDLLFKALVNYIEPKIRLETNRLETLRSQKVAPGISGKDGKRVAKELERQEDFLFELRDFEDKLRRAANLHLEPDLNDGVVLNIAPLHELVPWQEAEDYWEELLAGKYEWSSIGKQLRQKGLLK